MNENSTKYCSANSCPFAYTEESETALNYGCLPEPFAILTMRIKHGKTWACHSDKTKPCVGALRTLSEKGFENEVIDPELVTDHDDWSPYTKGYDQAVDEIMHKRNKA